jgi:hypothetical protein
MLLCPVGPIDRKLVFGAEQTREKAGQQHDDCNIPCSVLEVRVEIEPLSTSPISLLMDEKVGPIYRFLGHLSTACQMSLLVYDLLTRLVKSPCQATPLAKARMYVVCGIILGSKAGTTALPQPKEGLLNSSRASQARNPFELVL